MEQLEPRRLLATVTWNGAGDGTTWTSAANWIGGQVPGSNDNAVIGASSQTINLSGNITVDSVVSGAPLDVGSGSLTVQGGSSQANNGLTVASGVALTATGSGTSFSAAGTTVIDNASLFAQNGAKLSLSNVTSDTLPSKGGSTLQANGTGSVLSLPALTLITNQSSNTINLQALNGGQASFPALTSIVTSSGHAFLDAEETGSQLNVSALSSLGGSGNTLQAIDSGTILDSKVTSWIGGTIHVGGSSYTFSNLTSLDGTSVFVDNGGSLSLPSVTNYTNPTSGRPTFQANGANCVLSLPALTTITNQSGNTVAVRALNGAETEFPALTSVVTTNGQLYLDSEGSGSQLNVSALSSIGGSNNTLQVTNSGVILDGQINTWVGGTIDVDGSSYTFSNLTSIDDTSVFVDNGGSLSLPNITSYMIPTGGGPTLQANSAGSVLSFSALLTITNQSNNTVNLRALNGGEAEFPALTSIVTTNGRVYLDSEESGSQLNVSLLSSVGGSGNNLQVVDTGTILDGQLSSWTNNTINADGSSYTFSNLTSIDNTSVFVDSGGSLSLPNITSYTIPSSGSPTLQANSSGSVLGFPALTRITNQSSNTVSLRALSGAETEFPALTSIVTIDGHVFLDSEGSGSQLNVSALPSIPGSGNNLQMLSTGTILLNSQITTWTNNSINFSGSTFSFSNLTSIDNTSVFVSGGTLSFPNITSYTIPSSGGPTLQTSNGGAILNFPALTTITNQSGNTLSLQALNGGNVKFPVLTSIVTTNGHTFFDAEGSGSQLNVAVLTNIGGSGNNLQEVNTGTVLLASQITTWTNNFIHASGSAYTFSNLTSIDNTSVYVASGGNLSLPNITSYTIPTSGGATFQATGTGSVLDFPALATITNQSANSLTLQATSGGKVELPVLASILAGNGRAFLDSEGTGSQLDVPELTSVGGSNNTLKMLSAGGIILATGTFTLPGPSGTGVTFNLPSLPSGVALQIGLGTVTDATFNVPPSASVAVIGGTIKGNTLFNVGAGATVDLTGGGILNYSGTLTGNGAGTVQLSGGEIQLNASGLTLDFSGSMFQWSNGSFDASLYNSNITNIGTMNLTSNGNKFFFNGGTLDNSGTIFQSGTGSLNLANGLPTTVDIEPSASYIIRGDSGLSGVTTVVNQGTIRKAAGTGTSSLNIGGNLSNTGTIEADSGTLVVNSKTASQVSGTTLTGGTWNALNGSTLDLPGGTNIVLNQGAIDLDGASARIAGLANLAANSGTLTFTNGASFTTVGAFSNTGALTVGAGAAAGSTFNVTGNYSQANTAALSIQIGGAPNSADFGQLLATGSATLAGGFAVSMVNNFGPSAGQQYQVMSFTSSSGNFASFANQGAEFARQLTSTAFVLTSTSTAINGNTGDNVMISSTGSGNFTVTINGTSTQYSSSSISALNYDGSTSGYSKVVFDDPSNSYTVTQSLDGTQIVNSAGFQIDLNHVANLYVYGGSTSTATVDVPPGSGANFFVDSVDGGYSYIADPIEEIYSELSGFGAVNVSGSGGNTYAYVYSTSHAQVVGAPGQTTLTVDGVTSTLSNFPQVYVVGAADGTDRVTLDSSGGTFVGTPSFSYVGGTSNGSPFLIGALYAANVTAQAASASDQAVFYSYPLDVFDGAPGTSTLTGSTANVSGASVNFVTQASGYSSASVFESGAGTDVANLTSPGGGSFYGTSTASVLTVGSNSVTVNTYFVSSGQMSAVPGQLVVTGNHDGTDQAAISDDPGSNALAASGSAATLTTALGTVTINKFGSVTANKQNGSSDTVHKAAIDFTLSTVGTWTSV